MIRRTLLLILSLLLTACATTGSRFGCHATAKRGCTPVGIVNARAERGDYGQKPIRTQTVRSFKQVTSQRANPQRRKPERLQRIWLAPYTDRDHIYHEATFVDVVAQAAHWSNE